MGDFLDFLFREFAASGGGRGCSGSSCGNAPRKPPFPSSPSLSLSAEDRGEEDNFINHRGEGGTTTTEERGFPKYWLREEEEEEEAPKLLPLPSFLCCWA